MKAAPTRGSKPGERRGGRQKGVPNKNTAAIKDMILGALNAAGGEGGGQAYLEKQATENPVAFMGLVGKVLPMQLTGADGGPVQIARIELVGVSSDHRPA